MPEPDRILELLTAVSHGEKSGRPMSNLLLVEHLGVGSTSEARRLIEQGGVKLDGEAVTEIDVPRARLEGATVQAGKRRFARFQAA